MTLRDRLQADLERAQQAGDFVAQAETLMQLAKIAEDEGEYSIAQGLYGQAWTAYGKADDKAGMAMSLYQLSHILAAPFYYASGIDRFDFDRGAIYAFYLMAADYYGESGDVERQAMVYTTLGGEAYDNSFDIDVAQRAYEKALPLYKMTNQILPQAHTLERLGLTYRVDEPEYEQFLSQALTLYQQVGDKDGEERSIQALTEHL